MCQKILFWDFDGTLSRPNRSFSSALYRAAADVGYSLDEDAAKNILQNAYTWRSPFQDHTAEVGEAWWNGLFDRLDGFCREAGVPTDAFAAVHTRLREILTDVENYALYEDTVSTLKQCTEKGYVHYLLTNNYPEITDVVKKLGIAPYFTECIVSSHVGYDKPRQELYRHALEKAGYPSICYMIGDNPVADIDGAAAAGIRTIYVHSGALAKADYSIECLKRIPDLLL